MDPDNPVVKLCALGMEAEGQGLRDRALQLFLEAWNTASDHYERCLAAHYVARHQSSLAETLRWNQLALEHAEAAGDARVADFYPSLYLNLGRANEDLGNTADAVRYYQLAEEHIASLPDGPYRDLVQNGARRGVQRVTEREA